MAINPMQRKARNSFILGMLLMLVIAAIIITVLFVQFILPSKKQEQDFKAVSSTGYMLKRDIKSGEEITKADLQETRVMGYEIKKGKVNGVTTNVETMSNIKIGNIADEATIAETSIAKIDLAKGVVLTSDMLTIKEEQTTDDLRIEEYNMILLPTDISKNDFVDIRIMYPNGQNYIVTAKKRIVRSSPNTIFLKMTEDEILTISNAMVEAWMTEGSYLYATKYETPGIQKAATVTYPVSYDILSLIEKNPNIVEKAKNALYGKYAETNGETNRNTINKILSNSSEDSIERIVSGIEEKIQKQQAERARYIDTLGTGADY